MLTLVRVFWDHHRARFPEKKSRIIAGDVTVGIYKMKIICADRVSVKPYCDVNSKWHMPLSVEICRAKQKYIPFFGTAFWIFFPEFTDKG